MQLGRNTSGGRRQARKHRNPEQKCTWKAVLLVGSGGPGWLCNIVRCACLLPFAVSSRWKFTSHMLGSQWLHLNRVVLKIKQGEAWKS